MWHEDNKITLVAELNFYTDEMCISWNYDYMMKRWRIKDNERRWIYYLRQKRCSC